MEVAMLRRLGIVAILFLVSVFAGAQSCPPSPSLDLLPQVVVPTVSFQNADLLSAEDRREILKTLHEAATNISLSNSQGPGSLDGTDPLEREAVNLADEAAERVRVAYQNQGYFKVQVSAKSLKLATDSPQYEIVIHVDATGKQYRLGELGIIKAASFSTQQLRDLFPIQRGEIFSREKFANGLEQLRLLYGSQGYVNMTSVPNTELDDDNGIANLTVDVDEGKQFRLHQVEILGLDPQAKAQLSNALPLKPGNIFSQKEWDAWWINYFKDPNNPRPGTANQRLNEQNAWLDVTLDFGKKDPCPPRLLCKFVRSEGFCSYAD
jgi:hypothetical protein